MTSQPPPARSAPFPARLRGRAWVVVAGLIGLAAIFYAMSLIPSAISRVEQPRPLVRTGLDLRGLLDPRRQGFVEDRGGQ